MPRSMLRRRVRSLLIAGGALAGLSAMAAWPSAAIAGMGAVLPHYKPKPCSGDDCRADDPRSNEACQGLLCTFSSAKAMAPPVTAAQAAEAERARAAAETAQAAAAPVAVATATPKKHRHIAKAPAKTQTKMAGEAKVPADARPATAAPMAPEGSGVR